MKNISCTLKYAFSIIIMSSLLLFYGCKDEVGDDVTITHYIEVSDSKFYIDAKGGEFTVKVTPSPEDTWTVALQDAGNWLVEDESSTEKDILVFTVARNISENAAARTARIKISTEYAEQEIEVHQSAEILGSIANADGVLPRLGMIDPAEEGFTVRQAVRSRDGRYVGYLREYIGSDDIYRNRPVVLDLITGERHFATDLIDGEPFPSAISNTGTMVVPNYHRMNGYVIPMGGTSEVVDPGKYRACIPQSISADGFLVVGFGRDPIDDTRYEFTTDIPLVWENGVVDEIEFGETDIMGRDDLTQGFQIRGMSADGSKMYGSDIYNENFGAVWWDNGKFGFVSPDHIEFNIVLEQSPYDPNVYWEFRYGNRPYMDASCNNMSSNGKYITTMFVEVDLDNGNPIGNTPIVFDTETGETLFIEEYPGYWGSCVSNDGLVHLCFPGGSSGIVYDMKTGESKEVTEWIQDKFGIIISNSTGSSPTIFSFCDDGTVLIRSISGVGAFGDAIYRYSYLYYPERE